jgi:hypothetical protein
MIELTSFICGGFKRARLKFCGTAARKFKRIKNKFNDFFKNNLKASK